MKNLKAISEIIHDEAAKEAFYRFAGELSLEHGTSLESKEEFYETHFSHRGLQDLVFIARVIDCLRKLGYGV